MPAKMILLKFGTFYLKHFIPYLSSFCNDESGSIKKSIYINYNFYWHNFFLGFY